jgi:hypothetical protein
LKLKLLVLFLIIASIFSTHSLAVTTKMAATTAAPCVIGRTAPASGFWTWPANSDVKVYLRTPDFSEFDLSAVSVAIRNWDGSALENGSNVRFTLAGLTRETKSGTGEMTLVRGEVYNKKLRHLALLEAHRLNEDRIINYAVVAVDRSVKSPEVLTNVVAHEIGHTLGLLDCSDCNDKSTAMGLMKGAGTSNGIQGPTTCDKQSVGGAYRDLLARVGSSPAALALNKLVVDEGETPEEDETPVVERKP